MTRDWDAVSKLEAQFRQFKVFKTSDQGNALPTVTQLKSLTTNDIATEEIATDLLTADERRKDVVLKNLKERLVEKSFREDQKKCLSSIDRNARNRRHLQPSTKHRCKTESRRVTKKIKGDRQLMQ